MKLSATQLSLVALVGPALGAVLPEVNSYPGHSPSVDNRTLDQIYASAKSEGGELVVLWGGDEVNQGDSVITAWNARFPDVKLNLTVDVSKYHDSRVNRQFQRNGDDGADIAFLQTLHDFARWKREGRLLPYKPKHWDSIYASIKDSDGAFLGAQINGFGNIIYNNELLNETDVPSSYADFADPAWKSKLTLTYPNDDDAVAYLFSVIIDKFGWEWFDAIGQQDVQWVRGTGQPGNYITEANTTRSASFTTYPNGDTKLSVKTPEDTRMFWPQTAAIFATTQRPESSKLFLSWLISDERQQSIASSGQYVARKDLNSTAGSVWDDASTGLSQFGTFMENRELVEWWKLQFETSIGTAQGLSPVLSEYGKQSTL